MTYKAFISYSHSADNKLAPALQSALHRFAKPFYRLRAIRVFRDKTSLHLTPELWPLIQQALAGSEYFLLLASPDAAQSHWVQAEVAEWVKVKGGGDKILLVLTEGEMIWDDAANDFDWDRTDALPSNLRNVFRREPLYSDLRWARKATDLSLRNPQFLDEIGSLGATLHGKPKDEMIGNDVRQHRLFKMITAAALVLLLALTAAASSTAFYAVRQKNEAQRQTVEAERQRRSAVEAADRERKAAESERVARENEERERKNAEAATKRETVARDQAEERRREAERQRLLADQRRLEAERERNLANSRELAASADSQLASDPELSVMLSLKAHERTPTVEAEDALRRSLIRSHVRATFRTLNWFNVTYSPDGKWIVLLTSIVQVIEPRTWRTVAELRGPERWSSMRGVSFSRDGKTMLTVSTASDSKTSTLRLWETSAWRIVTELQFESNDALVSAALSPDGKRAATWSPLQKMPRVWNLATGASVNLSEQPIQVQEMVFSPDSNRLVMALSDAGGQVAATRVLDAVTGRMLSEPGCQAVKQDGMAFSPDGKYLALLCWKGTPQVLEAATGNVVAELSSHGAYPRGVAFSPDGKWLVTTGFDRMARVWETATWQPSAVLRGHTGVVEGVKFSGDGRVLVTSSADGTARVWETGTWRGLAILQGHIMPLYDLAISPDGRYVVTTAKDSSARVWEVDAGDSDVTQIDGASDNGLADAMPNVYSPDGKFIATRSTSSIVEVWEPDTGRRIAELGRGNFLAFSPDGKYAFTTVSPEGKFVNKTGSEFNVLMWNVRTWQKAAELHGHTGLIRSIAFSPDGRLVVTAGGELHVWDAGTGQSVAVLKDQAWRVAFSPDGKWIATARTGLTARIWEVGSWRAVTELRGHTQGVQVITFSRDSSRVVTGSDDGTARVWETGTWREVAVLQGHTNYVGVAEFRPDGRYVLTGSWDDTARLWEAGTGKLVAVLSGHTGSVYSARFSPDGRLIATAGDTTVRIWEAETGRPVTVLRVFPRGLDSSGSELSVRGVSFSPDGKSLLASGSNGTTRIYSWEMFAPLEDLLALGRTRVTRDLTLEEKKKYLHQVVDDKARPDR